MFWIRITSVTQCLPVTLVFDGLFSANRPWGILCMPLMPCILGLFASERLCITVLRSSAASLSEPHHTRTHSLTHLLTKAWKESDEGLCWQAEEAAAASGRVQSHRRMEGGGGRGRKFKTLIYQSYKPRLVTTDIHHSDRQTDLGAPQFFLVLSVNQGRILGLIYNNI